MPRKRVSPWPTRRSPLPDYRSWPEGRVLGLTRASTCGAPQPYSPRMNSRQHIYGAALLGWLVAACSGEIGVAPDAGPSPDGSSDAGMMDTASDAGFQDTGGEPDVITVSLANAQSVDEGAADAALRFPLSLSRASDVDVDIEYEFADGTATPGDDFVDLTTSLVIPAGTTTATISVPIVDDALNEPDETVQLEIVSVSIGRLVGATATGVIRDDDASPVISVANASVGEGDDGQTNLRFAIAVSTGSGLAIQVDYATADGSALDGADYEAVSGSLTIPPGQTSAFVDVAVLGDTVDEGNEVFTLVLSNPVNASMGTDIGTGTIVDDDAILIPPNLTVSIGDAEDVAEDTNDGALAFDLMLSEAIGVDVAVQYRTNGGSALPGVDYIAQSATATILAGTLSARIEVPITDDSLDELNETLVVELVTSSWGSIVDGNGTGVIVDDDPSPSLMLANASTPEGNDDSGAVGLVASLTAVSGLDVTFEYTTTDASAVAGADYVATSGQATIPAGSTQAAISVPILGDTTDEPDETFTVTISNPVNATLSQADATGTLVDDDVAPTLSVADATQTEGDTGSRSMEFIVTLSATSGFDITVDYATSDDSATAGTDYTAATGQLTIPAGSTLGTVAVGIIGDSTDEPNETLTLTLSAAVNATLADAEATGQITDDDAPPAVSIADASLVEGNGGAAVMQFIVTISEASAFDVSVDYGTANGTATAGSDYTATSGRLTIPAGSTQGTISVSILGDTTQEPDEAFTLILSNPANATVADGTAVGQITNDDAAPSISVADASRPEGNSGSATLEFDVTLSEPSAFDVRVDYATSDSTATAGSDYTATSGRLTIPAGDTQRTVSVVIVADTTYEPDEAFTVTLTNPTGAALLRSEATGTIINDDDPPTISVADATVVEGDRGSTDLTFEVTLSAVSAIDAAVSYTTNDGSAVSGIDFAASSGRITVVAGTTEATIVVPVFGDTTPEAEETLTLVLSNPSNASLERSSATGTIVDDDTAVTVGLDRRPSNLTCVAPPRPTGDASVSVVDAFPALPDVFLPTKMLLEPTDNPRWFVLQKLGQLVVFDPNQATSLTQFLEVSVNAASEGGLLGMAFHPNYPATPEVFLSYTNGTPMRTVISRFILDNTRSPGDGTVEQVILELDQDFDNHNGGDIAFGPDGYLYIGLGDGGDGGDPLNRAQDTTRLLGSMLRIDVLGRLVSFPDNPYEIPSTNPFAGNPKCGPRGNDDDCPEIYAWGLRNPWRWSFDPPSGVLWLADVGQDAWEEVNIIELGGNYGWRCREGANDFDTRNCGPGLTDPITQYPHSLGRSITGGYVYRGQAIPELVGRYVFADFATGRFWALRPDGQGGYINDQLIDTNFGPTSFGVGPEGELYFSDINTGRLRKLEPAGAGTPDTIATLLSNTGCTDPDDVTRVYSGLVPYDLNARFWSDNAIKDRHIGLPNGTTITRQPDGDWEFPPGTILVKNFRLGGRLIETRHLMRHPDGIWAGYTYEWNVEQTEATRVRGGKSALINGQTWIYPTEGQCMECHTIAAGVALGAEDGQLNRAFTYPQTSRTANQLATLDHIMMFASPLPGPPSTLPRIADLQDTSAPLTDRARAYLHTNCAQCHRSGGPTPSSMDLRYFTPLQSTNACDEPPLLGDLGVANARLIAPSAPNRSMIVNRTTRRDNFGMPPFGSTVVDTVGTDLLTDWINTLTSCP